MIYHAGLQVVTNDSGSRAAPILKHMDIAQQPGVFLHVQTGLHIGVLTVGQRGHKEVYLAALTRCRVRELHGRAGPVHLARGAGLVLQAIGQVLRDYVLAVAVAEPSVAIAELPAQLTLILILLPEQLQRHTSPRQLPLDVSIIRLLVDLLLLIPVGVEELVALTGGLVLELLVRDLSLLGDEKHLSD